jgi:hypothetical protein
MSDTLPIPNQPQRSWERTDDYSPRAGVTVSVYESGSYTVKLVATPALYGDQLSVAVSVMRRGVRHDLGTARAGSVAEGLCVAEQVVAQARRRVWHLRGVRP